VASPEEVASWIEGYERVYYDELREGIARHHLPSDAFPEFLKGASRIVATLGRDGVVRAHQHAAGAHKRGPRTVLVAWIICVTLSVIRRKAWQNY
jgi:hypothetical protein